MYMYHVYILKSFKHNRLYVGYTTNVKRRLQEHNSNNFPKTFTYRGRPWVLVYCESFLDETDARKREKSLKNYGNVFGLLKKRIIRSLESDG